MPIIEAGVFKNYYLDTYYAHKLSMTPTSGQSSNQIVAPGDQTLAQLIGTRPLYQLQV